MNKIYYNKLVRDRIPEIIKSKRKECEFDILDDEAYLKALETKLDEEVAEYHNDPSVEELADIITVLFALAKVRQINWDYIIQRAVHKACERGGFNDKIFLKWVEEK